MYEVIPGILEQDWLEIEKKIELVRPFAKTIHLDLLDGKFAPNTTFLDPEPFKKYSSEIFFELHLMVEDPVKYLNSWAKAGFKRFIGHIEKMPDQEDFIEQGRYYGEVGLAVDGPTSLNQLKVSIDELDYLLIMTIKAGFSGQSFTLEYLEKVKTIRHQSSVIPIEVDGGINDQTIVQAREAGATRFAATSFIYKTGNPKTQYQILRDLLQG